MEYFTLSNGIKQPVLGYGCNTLGRSVDDWRIEPDGDYRPLFMALEAGYRYFDTAIDYHNESAVGLFLEESGIERGELFLSTKLPQRPKYIESEQSVRFYLDRSFKRLRTNYLDMVLIHRPSEDIEGILRAWHVLEDYLEAGRIRAIGVSNFEISLLKTVMENARVKPMVNQIMINPGVWHRELTEFCLASDIRPTAWSPLRNLLPENRTELGEIGAGYGKSWAQVLLRFYIQRGIAVVPKSHYQNEIVENLNIFDFDLTAAELERIGRMEGKTMEFKL